MARYILKQTNLPKYMWSYAVMSLAYIHNRCYNNHIKTTLYEILLVPNISNKHLSGTLYRLICLVGRVFANDPGYMGSIPDRFIRKTLKMVLDASLLNTQQFKVRIKSKVEQSRERSSALPYSSV